MTRVAQMKCDNCDKTVDSNTASGWIAVRTLMVEDDAILNSFAEQVQEHGIEAVLDTGDFCTLTCASQWASGRALLRSLDADPEVDLT